MPRTKTSRQSNLRSSIYQGEDGYWLWALTQFPRTAIK